jgi:hypothetical protein
MVYRDMFLQFAIFVPLFNLNEVLEQLAKSGPFEGQEAYSYNKSHLYQSGNLSYASGLIFS